MQTDRTDTIGGVAAAGGGLWRWMAAAAALTLAWLAAPAPALAINAYITNFADGTVSVIDTAANMVTATIPVGSFPEGVAVTRTAARSMSPTGTRAPCR